MDDDYKIIENINDNEYLKNFKSFQYLQNSNYSSLLNYIDSDKFQVVIMGHSCGLYDRTLLNTIFEHNNCRSIKVYYHQWEDKETHEIKDNYTEINQNISRHFNKKKLMREKIVNTLNRIRSAGRCRRSQNQLVMSLAKGNTDKAANITVGTLGNARPSACYCSLPFQKVDLHGRSIR